MAAPMLKIETKVLKQLLQKLWSSKLSYRECSAMKQSIKELLQSDLPENADKEVIAEVNRLIDTIESCSPPNDSGQDKINQNIRTCMLNIETLDELSNSSEKLTFSESDIEKVIDKLHNGKSPDEYGISVDSRLRPSAVIYNLHAWLHKSIPNVSNSLSAKRVLTGKK